MIKVLDKGYVQLIEHMGSDLSVVNAARCSFDKVKEEFDEGDTKLIKYLAKHKHMLPFRHPQISLRIHIPIFTLRQLGKHQVGFSWSEVSRRYISTEPEFYEPTVWRKKPDGSIKQGSGENIKEGLLDNIKWFYKGSINECLSTYEELLKEVAPEMARMILPQSMYTTVYVTGSLLGWAHMFRERTSQHTQLESVKYAIAMGDIMRELYPVSLEALNEV
jgi:thymidylate synthase (FAD)